MCTYYGVCERVCERERERICVYDTKQNWSGPAVYPWPDSCSNKQVTSFPGEKKRQQWEGEEEGSVPLHSYQLSRLMRLDWTIGIN